MRSSLRLLALLCLVTTIRAQSLLPAAPIPLVSLAEFQNASARWLLAGGVGGDPRRDAKLAALPGTGVLINSPDAAPGDLATTWEHGDLDIDLEFLLAPGAKPAVWFQGRYTLPLAADGAGGGRAPGLWQHLHVEFRAPTFDASGRKVADARFSRVVLNGFVVAENSPAVFAPRTAAFATEKPLGPLVIQGDAGSFAVRALAAKKFGTETVRVENLAYKFYSGDFRQIGSYDSSVPKSTGTPARFTADAVENSGRFALVFTGSLNVSRPGNYAFAIETRDSARLVVDGRTVVSPLDRGTLPGTIELAAGAHEFRLDYTHTRNIPPDFTFTAEGPEIARHSLSTSPPRNFNRPRPTMLIAPGDSVRLQRGFVPFEPRKRLYAINVGTPAGVHYAYDFETGALLRVWRGNFLDVFEMWDGRGENQFSKPAGPSVTFSARPTVALLETAGHDWPEGPEALWSSQGYILEQDGQPVFLSRLADLSIRDRIAAAPEGRGITRSLTLKGENSDWQTWVLLAEAEIISPQPDGSGFVVGDRAWYIDVPSDSALRPVVRTRNGRQQLVVPVPGNTVNATLTYTLVW